MVIKLPVESSVHKFKEIQGMGPEIVCQDPARLV